MTWFLSSQAFTGNWYVQTIVTEEVNAFVQRHRRAAALPVNLDLLVKFNPNLCRSWFGAVMELINQITMLSIVLTGAALIRWGVGSSPSASSGHARPRASGVHHAVAIHRFPTQPAPPPALRIFGPESRIRG